MRENTPLTAGIDTAKDKLEVAIASSQQPVTLENAAVGWCQLAARLAAAGVGRVGIEASGGYERGVVEHLRRAGFTVLVLQPLQSLPRRRPGSRPGPECICGQSASAARVHLRRAKNDRIDAALIAACAALIDPPPAKPDTRLAALADHLTFIEQIEEDIARLKTRLEHLRPPRLRRLASAASPPARSPGCNAVARASCAASSSPSNATTTSRPAAISCSVSPASASAPRWPF
jgi:transposase